MRDCDDYHLDQTYAAGRLPKYIRGQSAFEARPEVKKLCSTKTLKKVLRKDKVLKDWQVQSLPEQPQIVGDDLYRCVVGAGMRKKPLQLKVPTG